MTGSRRFLARQFCLRPWAHRYPTEQAALNAAGRRAYAVGRPHYARACRCGRWHISARARRP